MKGQWVTEALNWVNQPGALLPWPGGSQSRGREKTQISKGWWLIGSGGVETVGEDNSLSMSDCGAQTLGRMMEEPVQWKKEWLFKQQESLEHH